MVGSGDGEASWEIQPSFDHPESSSFHFLDGRLWDWGDSHDKVEGGHAAVGIFVQGPSFLMEILATSTVYLHHC